MSNLSIADKFVMAANVLHGVDTLLVEAGFAQDSSARHQLKIAQSMFRDAERSAASEYICKCGLRIVPHNCNKAGDF